MKVNENQQKLIICHDLCNQVSRLHEQRSDRSDRFSDPHSALALPHDRLHAASYGPTDGGGQENNGSRRHEEIAAA